MSQQTTDTLKAALSAKYQPPEWAFFPEMRDGTGGNHTRTSDGFAMNCYPSRGLELHGFEIKATVGDLDTELRAPDKADALGRYMDFWWLVTTPEVWSARGGRVPAIWGSLVMGAKALKVIRKPGKIEHEPFPRSLLASILRRACSIDEGAIQKARSEAFDQGVQAARKSSVSQADFDDVANRLRRLQERVTEFESGSGITLLGYDFGRVGDGLKRMLKNEQAQVNAENGLRRLKEDIERALYS